MKKQWLIIGIISLSGLICQPAFGQGGPPDPPDDPNSGGGPVGGSSDLEGGLGLLLLLGGIYAGKKLYEFKTVEKFETYMT